MELGRKYLLRRIQAEARPRELCCSRGSANLQQFSTGNIPGRHGEFCPFLSVRWIGEADPPPINSPCRAAPVIESSPLKERRGLQNSCAKLDNPPARLPSMLKAFRM
jgi:hypothetical protein